MGLTRSYSLMTNTLSFSQRKFKKSSNQSLKLKKDEIEIKILQTKQEIINVNLLSLFLWAVKLQG